MAAHSLVFDTMLSSGPWKEQKESKVTIEDTKSFVFEALLHYFYTSQMPESLKSRSNEELFDVMYLVDKYDVKGAKQAIETELVHRRVTDNEHLEQMELADKYDLPRLKLVCELLLSTNLNQAFFLTLRNC